MNYKQASAKILELVNSAEKALEEATQLADEHQIGFDWSGCGYAMGGWYQPRPKAMTRAEAIKLLENSEDISPEMRYACKEVIDNVENDDESWCPSNGYDSYGWQASSMSC